MFIKQRTVSYKITVLLTLVLTWVVGYQTTSAETYGTITGKVVRKDRGAAPLAQVTVRVDSTALETQTDSTGWYVLDHVPPGMHKLTAKLDGFMPTIVHTFEVTAKVIRVDIALEDPLSRPQSWNDSTAIFGVIGGRILYYQRNRAIAFAIAEIDGTPMGAQANADGVYQIRRVPPGIYSLRGSLTGYCSAHATNVIVQAGTTTQVEFLLEDSVMETGVTANSDNRAPLRISE
ncbi:MAG: carboxypeptidase-like regulatory domain-containing protein [Patescibacteria group bacterium]|jgi:hypothetical protein